MSRKAFPTRARPARVEAVPRFKLDDERAFQTWLRSTPRAIVLWRGQRCTYSVKFEPIFDAVEVPDGWMPCLRVVEHGGDGPIGKKHGIEVTPTVIAYREGKPAEALVAKVAVGITRPRYRKWLADL